MRVMAFEATLEDGSPLIPEWVGRVSRTIAIREDQTLEQLHEALRLAFGWADPHLYC
jgi:Plasmid pRiA4b ORF-3-like protein